MAAIIDPALLQQLEQPDQAPPIDPNAPAPAGGATGSWGDAPPLTIRPNGAAPQQAAAPTGPVTDPQLLKTLNDAPDDQPASSSTSTAMDMLKAAGTGLVKGAAAIPGMVGDISNLADQAPSWLGLKAADALGMLPPGETFDSAMKFANSPVNQAAPQSGTLGAAVQAASPPTTQDILGNVQKVAGPLYQPQTTAGQITGNVSSFLPQAVLAPGNAIRNALTYGVVPGVASEAAGRAANSMLGDYADPWGRGIGAAIGAATGHLVAAPSPANALLSSATHGVSDADMAAATGIQQRAAALGISITPAEAIQQATGGRSNLGNLQRNVEGMHQSAPIMADYFAQRPAQVQQAASNVFDRIAPRPTDPFQTGVAAQNEAEGAMANIRQDRSNATSPYYQAAAGDEVPPARMAAVAQQLDALAAQNPNNPALTAPLSDLRRQIVATPAVPGQPAIPGQRVPVTDPNTGAVIRYNQTSGTPAVPPQPETYITNVGQLDKIYGGLRDQYTGPAPARTVWHRCTGGPHRGAGARLSEQRADRGEPEPRGRPAGARLPDRSLCRAARGRAARPDHEDAGHQRPREQPLPEQPRDRQRSLDRRHRAAPAQHRRADHPQRPRDPLQRSDAGQPTRPEPMERGQVRGADRRQQAAGRQHRGRARGLAERRSGGPAISGTARGAARDRDAAANGLDDVLQR